MMKPNIEQILSCIYFVGGCNFIGGSRIRLKPGFAVYIQVKSNSLSHHSINISQRNRRNIQSNTLNLGIHLPTGLHVDPRGESKVC